MPLIPMVIERTARGEREFDIYSRLLNKIVQRNYDVFSQRVRVSAAEKILVLWRGLSIAARAEDAFGTLLAVGVVCWFGFQAFENIGMTVGIMPVTGLPLPFVIIAVGALFAGVLWAQRRLRPELTTLFLVGLLLRLAGSVARLQVLEQLYSGAGYAGIPSSAARDAPSRPIEREAWCVSRTRRGVGV